MGSSGMKCIFADKASRARTEKQVVIFTSQSLIAYLHLRDLMPFFAQSKIKPLVFLTPDSKCPQACIPSLRQFEYYDSSLLYDVIFPQLEANSTNRNCASPTFKELMFQHACEAKKIEKLTDPAVREAIKAPHTIGAISIYQDVIFKPDFISSVKENGFFWNLHPALLPENQGLYAIFWLLMQGKTQHGYTLHEIEAKIDAGKIISMSEIALDKNQSVFELYVRNTRQGSNLTQQALEAYLRDGKTSLTPQDTKRSAYFSFPTEDDIARAREKGVRLWGDTQKMLQLYAEIFGDAVLQNPVILEALEHLPNSNNTSQADLIYGSGTNVSRGDAEFNLSKTPSVRL